MNTTTYTKAELEREARTAVRAFKKTLPAAIRRTVRPAGWELRILPTNEARLLTRFTDEAGLHEISVLI